MKLQFKTENAKALVNLINAASKDETRQALQCIQIVRLPEGNNYQATACDGHVLARIEFNDEYLNLEGTNYFNPEFIERLKIELKIAGKRAFSVDAEYVQKNDVNYPKVNQIIPETMSHEFRTETHIGLDLDLVDKVRKALDGCFYRTSSVKIEVKDKLTPVMLTVKSGDIKGMALIMPVRL